MDLNLIADAYLRFKNEKHKEDEWAWERVYNIVHDEPETGLVLTLLLVTKAADDNKLLADVAAGPLEDLLKAHGTQVIDRIERESKNSSRLQLALSGVWGINPGNPIFERWYALMLKYGFAEGKRHPL